MKKDSFAAPWKKVAENWEKYYAPPGRPSKEDRGKYAMYVKKALGKKSGRALVLGATPEVRNVLHKFPLEVTCIDVNLEMILAMNKFVPESDKDILIRGNWVENPLADNYFDIVLGDLTWGNVPKDQWAKFHKNIKRILKPGGYYIHRVTTIPENWKIQPIEKTLAEYEKLPYTEQRHMELFFHLLTDSYDSKNHTISLDEVKKDIAPFWKNNKIVVNGKVMPKTTRLIRNLFSFWGDSSKTWQTAYPKELKKFITPFFEVLEESISRDYLYPETSAFWFCKDKK